MNRLLMLLPFLVGCSALPRFEIDTIQDNVDQNTIYRATENPVGFFRNGECIAPTNPIVDQYSPTEFNLGVQKHISQDGSQHSLIVQYKGAGWFFIQDGNSLTILADKKRIRLQTYGTSSHRKVVSGYHVTESAWYPIKLSDLRKIADAKNVSLKITGQNRFDERCLTQENKDFFYQFLKETGGLR